MLAVHAAGGPEVGEMKMASSIFNAFLKHVHYPAMLDLSADPVEEFKGYLPIGLAFEFQVFFRLRVLNELKNRIGYQAEGFIVVSRL